MSPRRRSTRRRYLTPPQSPAAWISARARNALRRPFFITAVSVVTFIVSLMALIVVPQQAKKEANQIRPAASLRPDTEPTVTALREAERQVGVADSVLRADRTQLAQALSAAAAADAVDTTATGVRVTADVRGRRDSLAAQVEILNKLLARTENAPLLASYRTLAQAAPVQGDPRIKLMLDTLTELERERDSFSAVGGVDPVFVALTARANELGRNIEALADGRRAALRKELDALAPALTPAAQTAAARPLPDTLIAIHSRDAATAAAAGVAQRLARERAELAALDVRDERARELSSVGASPSALLAAALVFGAVLGFGVALFDEVRRPRIADAYEVERATGVKVLGVVKPLPPPADRRRRAADRTGPPFLDSGGDGHQLVYLNLAPTGTNTMMLTVTGDNPAVSAVVAINFAAIAADEARATLVVDTDGEASGVTSALRIRGSGGLAALASGSAAWPEAARSALVGRDRSVDVVPSGGRSLGGEELAALFQRDGARLTRNYDAIVVVSSPEQVLAGSAAAMPLKDVVVCARAGQTSIAGLTELLLGIKATGAMPRGIVLWNAPDPGLGAKRPSEEEVREPARAG